MLGCSSRCAASSVWCSHCSPGVQNPGAVSEVCYRHLLFRWFHGKHCKLPFLPTLGWRAPATARLTCSQVTTAVGKHRRAELLHVPNIRPRFHQSESLHDSFHEQRCEQQRVPGAKRPYVFYALSFPSSEPTATALPCSPWGTAAARTAAQRMEHLKGSPPAPSASEAALCCQQGPALTVRPLHGPGFPIHIYRNANTKQAHSSVELGIDGSSSQNHSAVRAGRDPRGAPGGAAPCRRSGSAGSIAGACRGGRTAPRAPGRPSETVAAGGSSPRRCAVKQKRERDRSRSSAPPEPPRAKPPRQPRHEPPRGRRASPQRGGCRPGCPRVRCARSARRGSGDPSAQRRSSAPAPPERAALRGSQRVSQRGGIRRLRQARAAARPERRGAAPRGDGAQRPRPERDRRRAAAGRASAASDRRLRTARPDRTRPPLSSRRTRPTHRTHGALRQHRVRPRPARGKALLRPPPRPRPRGPGPAAPRPARPADPGKGGPPSGTARHGVELRPPAPNAESPRTARTYRVPQRCPPLPHTDRRGRRRPRPIRRAANRRAPILLAPPIPLPLRLAANRRPPISRAPPGPRPI